MKELLKKIKNNTATIGIIGLGYVGLPLLKAFNEKKFKVIGFDIDKSKILKLKKGISYINHFNNNEIIKINKSKKFKATSDFKYISDCDVIILCVPTPLTKNLLPDLSPIINTAENIYKFIKEDQLIVLESSSYPGTTNEVLEKVFEKSRFKCNKDFYISYSPEREDPGNLEYELSKIPKLVGADTQESRELTVSLYKKIVKEVFSMSSTRVAEAAKLTENIYRSINIALVNELKIIFDAMDIDVWEVIEGASTKPFGFMPFYPGPGLGGHCIPIDPFYLSYKAKEFGVSARFIELAGEMHSKMPSYVVDKIGSELNKRSGKAIKKSSILVIGIAYKKDIDDMRESPALVIIESLESKGAEVDYHDKYIPKIPSTRDHNKLNGRKSISLSKARIKNYDLVLICTNHSNVDYNLLSKNAKIIIDTRNAMKSFKNKDNIIKA